MALLGNRCLLEEHDYASRSMPDKLLQIGGSNPGDVRVTLFRGRDASLSATEDLITHEFQATINEVLLEHRIMVSIEHLNWFNGARAHVDGPDDQVRRALEVMRTDHRLAPYFSRMVIEEASRVPGPNEAGWKSKYEKD
jgi:hypothetical protein